MLHPLILGLLLGFSCALAEQNPSVLNALEAFQKERAESLHKGRAEGLASLPKATCGCSDDKATSSVVERLQQIKHQETKKAVQDQKEPPKEIKVLVFISSSMNEADLKNLVEAAPLHQAALIMRGLIDGDVQKTLAFVHSLKGSVMLDPRLFKAFQVHSVPTFVKLHQPLKIEGGAPQFEAPSHDVVRGNLTLQGALHLMEGRGA